MLAPSIGQAMRSSTKAASYASDRSGMAHIDPITWQKVNSRTSAMYRTCTCEIIRLATLPGNGRFRFLPGSSLHPIDEAFQASANSTEIAKHPRCHKEPNRRRSILCAIPGCFANKSCQDLNRSIRFAVAFRVIRAPDSRGNVRFELMAGTRETLSQFTMVQRMRRA